MTGEAEAFDAGEAAGTWFANPLPRLVITGHVAWRMIQFLSVDTAPHLLRRILAGIDRLGRGQRGVAIIRNRPLPFLLPLRPDDLVRTHGTFPVLDGEFVGLRTVHRD